MLPRIVHVKTHEKKGGTTLDDATNLVGALVKLAVLVFNTGTGTEELEQPGYGGGSFHDDGNHTGTQITRV